MTITAKELNEKREILSDLSHEIWSSWMHYLFSKCTATQNGDYVIPAASVKHWLRQMKTQYKNLSEKEKDSDREQADKICYAILRNQISRTEGTKIDEDPGYCDYCNGEIYEEDEGALDGDVLCCSQECVEDRQGQR